MRQTDFPRQILNFQKATFDNGFQALILLQDQTEKSFRSLFDQATPWMPAEGRKAVDEWLDMCKKGQHQFKKMMDENFQKAEQLFSAQQTEAEQPAAKAAEEKPKSTAKSEKAERTTKPVNVKKASSSQKETGVE